MANQIVTLKLTITAANRIRQTLIRRRNELMAIPRIHDPFEKEELRRELGEITDIINREFG